MFWGGKTLVSELNSLIRYENGAKPSPDLVDCSAITLTLGSEVFVTPSDKDKPKEKIILTTGKPQFTIPMGQFAFLLTEEFVSVPVDAMAFISFKAGYKLKGLINVSGFHVDPGWDGRVMFSVFNAGPNDIVLERGDKFALIWYASLDEGSKDYAKSNTKQDSISSNHIANMAGEVYSPFKLRQEIEELKDELQREKESFKEQLLKEKMDLYEKINKSMFSVRLGILAVIFTIVLLSVKNQIISFLAGLFV